MSGKIPPPPRRDQPLSGAGGFTLAWDRWFQNLVNVTSDGFLPWAALDMDGSDHEDLEIIQGGTTSQHYHLTSAEYTELQRADNVASVSSGTSLSDANRTVIATTSGITITLPAASTARVGKDWTVYLGTAGWVDVTVAGSDTFLLEDNEDTLRLDEEGASVTVRCITATSWGLV